MRSLSFAFAALVLSGCGSNSQQSANAVVDSSPAPLNAEQVAAKLKNAGLPVSDLKVVTAESDDNKLLGRPGQYSSKVFFFDARHPKGEDDNENTIEVFDSEADAVTRRDYIEGVTKGVPMLLQYQLLNGKVLVRLSKTLLPAEADAYKKALAE